MLRDSVDNISIIPRFVWREDFLERRQPACFAQRGDAQVHQQMIMIVKHVEQEACRPTTAKGHASPLPLALGLDIGPHRILCRQRMYTVQYVSQPTRLQVVCQCTGDRGGVTHESQTLNLWMEDLTIEVKAIVRDFECTAHCLIEKTVVRFPARREDDDVHLAVTTFLQCDTTGREFGDFGF